MKNSMVGLQQLIAGFQLSCQTEGKSPRTIEWYTSFLNRFQEFLVANNIPPEMNGFDRNQVRAFIRYLQTEARTPRSQQPLSGATVQAYVRTLKVFFAWINREGYSTSNPMVKIPVPKAVTRLINTFSNRQIEALLGACRMSNSSSQRNLAILLLLLDTGVRVSELVGIDVRDVDLAEGQITIKNGKGRKERLVPIGSLVRRALWKYINSHRPQPATHNISALFLNGDGIPLTKNGVQQMLRRCGRRAAITGVRCSPHTFRHTFAKNYLLNGGDIFSLQKILGHSSMASVRTYLNLFSGDVKEQHRRFSPVDNMADKPTLHRLCR